MYICICVRNKNLTRKCKSKDIILVFESIKFQLKKKTI